ncbi:MAG: hypothetical protein GY788_17620 [bacterium]|nr:hypothetical protein [bacterium]
MTKKKTNADLWRLDAAKELAIDAIVTGANHTEAADAAGVHRVTVSKWANHHPAFQAELNKRRSELASQRADQIRHIDAVALDRLEERIVEGDPKAVDTWIKARGLHRVDTTDTGEIDPDAIIDAEVDNRMNEINADLFRALTEPPPSVLGNMDLAPDRAQVRRSVEAEMLDKL